MSRSKHTDPRALRAQRRQAEPSAARSLGDLSRRRRVGLAIKRLGVVTSESKRTGLRSWTSWRVRTSPPPPGFHHPASAADILKFMEVLGPASSYGLRSIELTRQPRVSGSAGPRFGGYLHSGRILLFAQPPSPWRWTGFLKPADAAQFRRAGARIIRLTEASATLVEWPPGTLRQFMLETVLLHELGHHLLQHERRKPFQRAARTKDHEAFANRVAARQRFALRRRGRPGG